jgi:autotransporter family porin
VKNKATIIILTLITAIVICGTVSAADYTVGPGETYTTIQSAVTASGNGDNINVNPNNGNPYIETINIDHPLNIVANGEVTVQKVDLAGGVFHVFGSGSGTTIQGFTITKTDAAMADSGIALSSVDNCHITNNKIIGFGSGINVVNSDNNIISGNTITSGPNAGGYSYGIENYGSNPGDSSNNQITYNIITPQAAGTGEAISIALYSGNGNQIIGNVIKPTTTGTGALIGIILDYSGNVAHFNQIIATTAIELQGECNIDARYNWFGSNNGPTPTQIPDEGVLYDPWLIMIVSASPTTIYTGGVSNVYADFTHDSSYDPNNPVASYHDPSLGHFPDNVGVYVTSAGGEVGSLFNTVYTVNGIATAFFRATLGPGTGSAAGSLDSQDPLGVNINILQAPAVSAATNSVVNAASNTVGMQTTGAPIGMLILALLAVIAGFVIPRKM